MEDDLFHSRIFSGFTRFHLFQHQRAEFQQSFMQYLLLYLLLLYYYYTDYFNPYYFIVSVRLVININFFRTVI